jgi:hypothetical protein
MCLGRVIVMNGLPSVNKSNATLPWRPNTMVGPRWARGDTTTGPLAVQLETSRPTLPGSTALAAHLLTSNRVVRQGSVPKDPRCELSSRGPSLEHCASQ